MSKQSIPDVDLSGKTVIVTGANTGIGKETARELLRRGARVILACRDQSRGETARQDIIKDTGKDTAVLKILDLGSLISVKAFADDINSNEDRLDILVNNAGICTKKRQENEHGVEMTFAVNHLGHFYLTKLLLDKLKASAPSRIVIVSSKMHEYYKINMKDLNSVNLKSYKAYGKSKTANILHATELTKQLEGTGVSVYSLHPGFVRTEITRDYGDSKMVKLAQALACCYGDKMVDPPEGALTTLYCCLEPSIAQHTGKYYEKCNEKSAKHYATDPNTAQKLWEVSVEMCAAACAV